MANGPIRTTHVRRDWAMASTKEQLRELIERLPDD
jgi:hypothetical protein